ncbi:hypothetical protein FGL86_00905 [Pistricoccus aurantiacus]|uniref:Uncharacterized protein n=1 Tax=Pistricoccus aurantiacus TaxID=1883414 RepID=A0A5B8SNJ4_9GAMM|nr:hypothetical protein [Pistricoccus aurantiacus]QEA37764.1 hypothetical protein FGL86_00905 [Pistricoccus aurantiacus]
MFMQWLNENSGAISAITGIITVFVWLFYAQLLYANYSRQTRPKLIVNRSAGKNLDSHCLISNMSSEAIYMTSVIGVVGVDEKTYVSDITDSLQGTQGSKDDSGISTFQGPISAGGYYLFSKFRNIISFVLDNDVKEQDKDGISCEEVDYIEIRVVAVYGSENKPVGFYRQFNLGKSGAETLLIPDTFTTLRMPRRKEQKWVKTWLSQIEPQE